MRTGWCDSAWRVKGLWPCMELCWAAPFPEPPQAQSQQTLGARPPRLSVQEAHSPPPHTLCPLARCPHRSLKLPQDLP